ncbi:hypothetical protein MTR_7g105010 [Medicago truncatula]|uniref:Uncharacterized protein n=1 Tax=Medicago truncatula TaxID=3880 RepID=G7KQY0_MEDTR|nr:hypothetical protein MTR_7g105010 [Medicago truncatula]
MGFFTPKPRIESSSLVFSPSHLPRFVLTNRSFPPPSLVSRVVYEPYLNGFSKPY